MSLGIKHWILFSELRVLDKRKFGQILLIAPSEEIADRERRELQAEQEKRSLEPLQSELIRLNFSKAADVAALLKNKR